MENYLGYIGNIEPAVKKQRTEVQHGNVVRGTANKSSKTTRKCVKHPEECTPKAADNNKIDVYEFVD